MYYTLLTSGKLYEHLAEIDTSARDMAEYLIKEMAKKQVFSNPVILILAF